MASAKAAKAARAELERDRDRLVATLDAAGEVVDLTAVRETLTDAADLGNAALDRSHTEGATKRARRRLDDVVAALARIDAGTWGDCADCADKIASARLEALPATTVCVDCASSRRRAAA